MHPTTTSRRSSAKGTFLLALVIAALFLVPEYLFSRFADYNFHPAWRPRELLTLLIISLLIAGCRYRLLALTSILIVYVIQLSELWHMSYFGAFYSPSQVILLFEDSGEIAESALAAWHQMLPPLVTAGLCAAAAMYASYKFGPGLFRSRVFDVMLILSLTLPAIGAMSEVNSRKYEPDAQTLAIKNGLYAVSFFLGNDLPGRLSGRYRYNTYLPYKVANLPRHEPGHVVLILGESTSTSHWHLYGYDKPTTPRLDALAREAGFIKRIGIATAVSTRSAVPMLLNSQREPDNVKNMRDGTASLFRLAKRTGYQTAFLSTQIMDKISSYLSAPDIDHWQEIGQLASLPGRLDYKLLSAVSALSVSWDKPVFLVVNPRCCHSPYESYVPERGPTFVTKLSKTDPGYRGATYDDAMLYLDELVTDLILHIDRINKQTESPMPITFVMLSDHGEKLGEDNQYGHNHLDLTTALTPFFVYSPNGKPAQAEEILNRFPCVAPHYAASLLIARLLGYRIDNPNEDSDVYYINGIDISGRAGFIDYRLSDVRSRLGACSAEGQ